MATLVTSDLHFSDNPRDAYRHDFQKILRKLVRKHKVDTLLILGDITEEKDRHPARLVNKVVDHIVSLAYECDVFIIQGNHDATDPDNPFFEFVAAFQDLDNGMGVIKWISKPILWDFKDIGKSLLLPYTNDAEHDWGEWRTKKNYDWVFTHATFDGAAIGHGRTLGGIPRDFFPDRVEVISGDIHVPQTLGNVTYVGAPYLVDFGDDYQPRVLLLTEDKVKSIKVDGPQKRLVEFDVKHDVAWNLDRLADEVQTGDILKVRVPLKPEDQAQWPEIQKRVRDWGAEAGYTIYIVQPQMLHKTHRKRTNQPKRSDSELVQEYGKSKGFDKATIKEGLRILEGKDHANG